MAEATRVQVEIGGRTYTLRGDRDPRTVKELAEYVDGRMAEIAAHSDTADTTRLAVLTALNLADELFAARSGSSRPAVAHAARDRELCRILDQVLAS